MVRKERGRERLTPTTVYFSASDIEKIESAVDAYNRLEFKGLTFSSFVRETVRKTLGPEVSE